MASYRDKKHASSCDVYFKLGVNEMEICTCAVAEVERLQKKLQELKDLHDTYPRRTPVGMLHRLLQRRSEERAPTIVVIDDGTALIDRSIERDLLSVVDAIKSRPMPTLKLRPYLETEISEPTMEYRPIAPIKGPIKPVRPPTVFKQRRPKT